MNDPNDFKPGLYRHYKGGRYRALLLARDHDTQEPMVVYVPLEGAGPRAFPSPPQVRPLRDPAPDAWNDLVRHDGQTVRRFEYIGS